MAGELAEVDSGFQVSFTDLHLKYFPFFSGVIKHDQNGIVAQQDNRDNPEPAPVLIVCPAVFAKAQSITDIKKG